MDLGRQSWVVIEEPVVQETKFACNCDRDEKANAHGRRGERASWKRDRCGRAEGPTSRREPFLPKTDQAAWAD